jgi:hypothetical protein
MSSSFLWRSGCPAFPNESPLGAHSARYRTTSEHLNGVGARFIEEHTLKELAKIALL